MGKGGRKFRNQSNEQIVKHLENMLKPNKTYDLFSDPLGIYFEIRESARQPRRTSEKMMRFREESSNLSKKKRRLTGTRKRTRPKIRTVKKGRTVNLKGVTY